MNYDHTRRIEPLPCPAVPNVVGVNPTDVRCPDGVLPTPSVSESAGRTYVYRPDKLLRRLNVTTIYKRGNTGWTYASTSAVVGSSDDTWAVTPV